VRDGYYKAAKQWHPDKNKEDPQAESRFKLISEAYEARHFKTAPFPAAASCTHAAACANHLHSDSAHVHFIRSVRASFALRNSVAERPWQVLSNPEKRKAYDEGGREGLEVRPRPVNNQTDNSNKQMNKC
jgi:hypothetical protein